MRLLRHLTSLLLTTPHHHHRHHHHHTHRIPHPPALHAPPPDTPDTPGTPSGPLGDELEKQLRRALADVPADERRASDERVIDAFVESKKADFNPVEDQLGRRLDEMQESLEARVESELSGLRAETAAKIDAAVADLLASRKSAASTDAAATTSSPVASDGPLAARLPTDACVAVAGADSALGERLLSALAERQPAWKLVGLVESPDAWTAAPGGAELRAYSPFAPTPLARSLADADALVILCDKPCGAGGVEQKAMGRLMKAVGTRVRRLLVVSCHGVERTAQLPYTLQNAFGGALDKQRAAEQEAILRSQKAGEELPAYAVARFGKLTDGGGMAAAGAASQRVELAPGDALSADIPAAAASSVLVEALLRDEAINATFSAATGQAVSWDDEFVKLVGPELLRLPLARTSATEAAEWLRVWAQLFLRPGSGLTTPVQVVDIEGGVLLRFIDQGGGYKESDEEENADAKWKDAAARRSAREQGRPAKGDGALRLVAEAEPSQRVRVCRAEMDEGVQVKPMSEETVLQRLERDLSAFESGRG